MSTTEATETGRVKNSDRPNTQCEKIMSVASLAMAHWSTCPTQAFKKNAVHSAAAASFKMSKITKEKHFRSSRQKHAKTHVNRFKQSRIQTNPWHAGEERK